MTRYRAGFRVLDKDLGRVGHAEVAQMHAFRPVWRLGLGVLGLVGALLMAMALSTEAPGFLVIGVGLVVGAWLGMSIGANDIANSLGPAVGAGAIRLLPGLCLVAAAEIAGAVLAGGAVSDRLAEGIITMSPQTEAARASMMMVAALIGAAVWITLATGIGLPVSTSHSIVGAVAGAGAVALGPAAVTWATMGMIATVWMATPVVAGAVAGALLILLRRKVIEAPDRAAAALRWFPPLIGLMVGLFTAYVAVLVDERIGLARGAMIGAVAGMAGCLFSLRSVRREIALNPGKPGIRPLLRPALVVTAVLMGFAHGANDVGNVTGPLSVILRGQTSLTQGSGAPVLLLAGGGAAIAAGALLFGRRLVHLVGSGITSLNAGRAFCVSLATAVTVMAASFLGLPVSSTHVAVGGVFGVGFAREWLDRRLDRTEGQALPADETERRELVRRSHVVTITAAWIVTVPISAALGALSCLLVLWATGV